MSGPFALVRCIGRQVRARLLERLLDRFLECPDWASAERLVATRRQLTGDDALALLTTWETATRELGDHVAADGYEYHRLLLERCRREGPDRVFGELTAPDEDEEQRCVELTDTACDAIHRATDSGRPDDLDSAVDRCEQAADSAATASQRAATYGNLGVALLHRAGRTGSENDVTRAVDVLEAAYALTPPNTDDRLVAVTNLAWALTERHRLDGLLPPLDRAVELLRRVVEGEAPADPDGSRPSGAHDSDVLTNLASALRARYFHTGASDDMAEAVAYFDWAVCHSSRSAAALGNLGVALSELFSCTRSPQNLRRAQECLREALTGTDTASPERSARLAHLGAVLTDRYIHEGQDLLDEAVELFIEAERSTPDDSPDRTARSSDLGTALLTRYERHGDLADLDLAVLTHERAAAGPYYEKSAEPLYLDQLGMSLRLRARRHDHIAEAHRAVLLHERAVALTGADSPDLMSRQVNHAAALRLYAELSEDATALKRSVEVYAQVSQATTAASPHEAAVLTNHANALRALAHRTGQTAPLDEAIGMLRKAVAVTAARAPERPSRLCDLGHALIGRGRTADTEEAVHAYRESCRLAAHANIQVKLVAGRAWGEWAAGRGAHEQAAEAFGHAADAIGQLVRTQLTRPAAETWLASATEVSAEAAHACAAAGDTGQAVRWLELGRARLLSAALRGEDADVQRLRDDHPDLARRFRRAAAQVRDLELQNGLVRDG
ncbi:hypothetical protein [Streptomyces europaeiscabiei]|uniref:hypothetical protein n=1 Tax=Streptomyces europaeiscabiei TaxID=146819 RepID=UPI0029B4EFC8|nr:hypothetical protein [Streptomyces europaeiscabiei]MDX3586623.1 hypothetical protein [Streptomyces europaeiscabiei]